MRGVGIGVIVPAFACLSSAVLASPASVDLDDDHREARPVGPLPGVLTCGRKEVGL